MMTITYKKLKDPISGTESGVVKKDTNDIAESYIPFAEGNTDYAENLEWLAEGNTAEAAD